MDDEEGFLEKIVRIYVNGVLKGAGFLISRNKIVTCRHVVSEVDNILETLVSISVDFPFQKTVDAMKGKILFVSDASLDKTDDILILEIERPFQYFAIYDSFLVGADAWDKNCRAYGFPKGYYEGIWASAALCGKQSTGWIQIEGTKVPGYHIDKGFSGGPVWSDTNKGVIGIIVAVDIQAEKKVAFMIPSDTIVGFISRVTSDNVGWNPLSTEEITVGRLIKGQYNGNNIIFNLNDLRGHAFIAGLSGSGKTQSVFNIIRQVWSKKDIPFLVMEPCKAEYRMLEKIIGTDDVNCIVWGDSSNNQYFFNFFEIESGIDVKTHIELLLYAFFSSIQYLPYSALLLLRNLFYDLYKEKGWDVDELETPTSLGISQTQDGEREFPSIQNLIDKVKSLLERENSTAIYTKDTLTAIYSRLVSVQKLFIPSSSTSTRHKQYLSISKLLSKPTILELRQIGDDDLKALFMRFVYIRIYENHLSRGTIRYDLHHVTIIEEAHRLFNKKVGGNDEMSRFFEQSRDKLSNILHEIKAYGEGFILIDQMPARIQTEPVKYTSIRLFHRLLAQDDRDFVQEIAGLTDSQTQFLPKLHVGEALFFSERTNDICLVQIQNSQILT
jgi:DNA helicase HerA-like ATPase